MSIRFNRVTLSILYLMTPIIVFFLTWLKSYVGIPASVLLGVGTYYFFRKNINRQETCDGLSSTKEAVIASLFILVYLLLSGHGTIIGSAGYDTPWRNAMYQDLIHQAWPVIYEYSKGALVYYMTYWLVPAGISYLLGLSEFGSNLVLVIWTYLGLRVFVSLLWQHLHIDKSQIIPITVFFLFWGGLNIVGMLIMSALDFLPLQIDTEWGWHSWWYTGVTDSHYQMAYMIRTVYVSLADIPHQFVPMLLVVLLFLKYRQVENYAFLGLLLLPYSPLGFIGMFLLMGADVVRQGFHHVIFGRWKVFIQEMISIPNVLAVCTIFPVFLLYFTVNNSVARMGTSASTGTLLFAPFSEYGILRIFVLFLYYLFQFGIFMRLCYQHSQDKFLFWSVFISLLIIPLFRVGMSGDFCWNASMPGFYILMVFMMQEVLWGFRENKATKHFFILVMVITLAVLTPCLQIASGLRKCSANGTFLVNVDHAYVGGTFSNKSPKEIKSYGNFVRVNYEHNRFYLFLARKN